MPNSQIIEVPTAYAFTGDRVVDAAEFMVGALELVASVVAK